MALASAVHTSCVRNLGMNDLGVNGSLLGILAGLHIPGLLVEGGNLMNAGDAALIADGNHRDRMAGALARGLESYRRVCGRGPKPIGPASGKPDKGGE